MRFLFLAFISLLPLYGEEAAPLATRPLPRLQVLPLPHAMASFQTAGRELTTAHFAPADPRPFWYPILTAHGISLTRMGHPYEPVSHSHHNSVWIAHQEVNGLASWLLVIDLES